MASLLDQLKKISIKQIRFDNGETIAERMAREAQRLADCIQYYIDKYYNSYHPKVYDRTDRFHGALYAEDIADIRIIGNTIRIAVRFNKDLATHPNLESVYWSNEHDTEYFTEYRIPIKDRHESFVPVLMNSGWHSEKLEWALGQRIPRLTYFEGIHFIENGIKKFNRTNTLGIEINADDVLKRKAY